MDDLMAGMTVEPVAAGMRIRMHDRGVLNATLPASEATVFYTTPGPWRPEAELGVAEWRPRDTIDIVVGGRQWLLEFDGAPARSPWLRPLPLLALCAGLVVSLLLYAVLRAIALARFEAISLAQKATRELRTQLSFTQQLIEAMPNPVFYKDADGRYLGCNAAFEDYSGHPRERIIGKTVIDVATADVAARAMSADRALLASPGSQIYEANVFHAKDKQQREELFNKATFFDPSGAVAGIVGVLVDITERKTLEADTRESAERLRAVILASPLAIIARDMDKRISMWNPAAERMFGWTEA